MAPRFPSVPWWVAPVVWPFWMAERMLWSGLYRLVHLLLAWLVGMAVGALLAWGEIPDCGEEIPNHQPRALVRAEEK